MKINDFVLLGLAFLGFAFRIFEHLYNDKAMTFSKFFRNKQNIYRTILSFISIVILYALKDDLKALFNVQAKDYYISIKFISVAIGYFNYRLVSFVFNFIWLAKSSILKNGNSEEPKNNSDS